MLLKMVEVGLIYKNRYGKYSFAVPMLSDFIKRQSEDELSFDSYEDTSESNNEEDQF